MLKLFLGLAIMFVALALSFYYPVATICIIGLSMIMNLFPPEAPVYEQYMEVEAGREL